MINIFIKSIPKAAPRPCRDCFVLFLFFPGAERRAELRSSA